MLKDRLFSSAILLSLVGLLLWLDARFPPLGVHGLWLVPLLLLLAVGTANDMVRLFQGANRLVNKPATLVATALIPLAACIPYGWELASQTYPADCPVGRVGWMAIGAVLAIGCLLLVEMSQYGRGPAGATERLQAGVFVAAYVGIPMSLLVAVRNLEGANPNWGLAALISLIAVTKSSDAGAYFTGQLLGRHKLIPRLSPGKTWEGSIGGFCFSVAVAYGCVHWLFPALTETATTPPPWWGPLIFGIACALSGMLGDLAESLIKRDTGAKDSGSMLPGLGGVWDVTDSLIAASAPGFLCLAGGLAGS